MFIQSDKTSDEIRDDILAEVPDTYQKTVGFWAWDYAAAMSIELKKIWDSIVYVWNAILDIRNLSDEDFARYVFQTRGIAAKVASFSKGLLTLADGSGQIKDGDFFETSDGLQFVATETKDVEVGDKFNVECSTAGSIGNVPVGSIVVIPATITGIVSVTNEEAFTNGYDAETKDALYERYIEDLQKPITSSNIYHYEKWAKEKTGVGKAKTKPLWDGDNTVKVVIVDSNYNVASNELVTEVQNYIDPYTEVEGEKIGWGYGNGTAPTGAYCTVESATAKSINIAADITLKSATTLSVVQANVQNAIETYLKTLVFSEEAVSYAKIGAAILSADGVSDYANLLVNGANDNVALLDNNTTVEIPVVGTLNLAEAGGA